MTSWLAKAAVQGAVSLLPESDRLNHLLQRHVTGSAALTRDGFALKLDQCRRHLEAYRRHRAADRDRAAGSALELGTGWYPIVPVGLALAGVERVTTIDVRPLCDLACAHETVGRFAAALDAGALRGHLPEIDPGRAERLRRLAAGPATGDPRDLLEPLGIGLLVGDARHTGMPAASVDLFVSNNTFEHIPPEVLRAIVREFHRLARPAAVMDHFVDISDHYAHFDPRITEFNYLRYGERAWRLFNNRLQYQNRLRISDYRAILAEAGFRVVAEEAERGTAEQLEQLEPAARFRRYSREDLLVLRCWLTAVAEPVAGASRDRPGAGRPGPPRRY
jgi:hypothetical protein